MKIIAKGYPAYAYTGGVAFDPALPAVLLLHGAAMDHSAWQWQARYLAHHGFAVIAPDLPGHGRSPGAARTRVEALADWAIDVLDALGRERACVAGHSLGSLVALDLAMRHPGRVAAMALVGVSVPMPVGEAFLAAARDDDPAAFDMEATWGLARHSQLATSPAPGLVLQGANRQLMGRAAPGVQYADLSACHAYAPRPEAIRAIAAPTLVIAGRRDVMTPSKAGQALAREVPGARLEWVDSGHGMPGEAPREVTRLLHAHFAGPDRPTAR